MKSIIITIVAVSTLLLSCSDDGGRAVPHNQQDPTDYPIDNPNNPINPNDQQTDRQPEDNSSDNKQNDANISTDDNSQNTNNTDTQNVQTDPNHNQTNIDSSGEHDDSNATEQADSKVPEVPFEYELTSFPGGDMINHDGKSIHIKPFKMFTHHVYVSYIWDCIVAGQCSKDIFEWMHDGCVSLYSSVEDRPVNCISYEGAVGFCHWLGGRLPTEAEWEYAALFDGEKVRDVDYAWGNEAPDLCVNASFKESKDTKRVCACGAKSIGYPRIIELKDHWYEYSASPCASSVLEAGRTPTGLTHISGNLADYVAEFEEDHDNMTFLVKGGSFLSPPEKLKITEREYVDIQGWNSTTKYSGVGFRCVFDEDIK